MKLPEPEKTMDEKLRELKRVIQQQNQSIINILERLDKMERKFERDQKDQWAIIEMVSNRVEKTEV